MALVNWLDSNLGPLGIKHPIIETKFSSGGKEQAVLRHLLAMIRTGTEVCCFVSFRVARFAFCEVPGENSNDIFLSCSLQSWENIPKKTNEFWMWIHLQTGPFIIWICQQYPSGHG
ncbi:hypothetical protein CDAR_56051 [Caerostris darwini]|uniref:Uncharacterized protein n=1 Tax=Caerostris darwini TaxID=1538125 RepID=A0AAV4RP75_9ARAC|nr:hypothetical protein CDAR_56051 [Caerostris darwini]